MPLAKDLLHPLPEEERRKHKLKRLVQHPNSYFMDVKCPGIEKLLQNHNSVQSCSDSGAVCWVFHHALSTHRWACTTYGRMLLSEKTALMETMNMKFGGSNTRVYAYIK